jgi:hypothetical protein
VKPARARRVLDQIARHVVSAAKGIRRWVKGIWRRFTNERGYAEAVAELVVAAADLFVDGQQLRRLLHQASRTFVIVIRSLMGDEGMPDTYWS